MPLDATVATATFSDVHVAVLVRSSVAPVDSVTVAVNCAVPPGVVISAGPLTRTAVIVAVPDDVVVGVGDVTVTVRVLLSSEQPAAASIAPNVRAAVAAAARDIPIHPDECNPNSNVSALGEDHDHRGNRQL